MATPLPSFDFDSATPEQREAAMEIQQDRNLAGQPLGAIWSSLMPSPDAARRVARVGAHCRFNSVLSEYQREVVILAAASAIGFEYEARYHEEYAARLGVPGKVIASVLAGHLQDLPDELRCIAELSRAVALGENSTDAREVVRTQLGETAAIDLVVTAGYYVMLHRISGALLP